MSYFIQGLIITVPLALTFWILGGIFVAIDGWTRTQLRLNTPGAGFVATILVITITGLLGSHLFTRRMVDTFERLIDRVPVVKLLHTAFRDVMTAFVGPDRRFDRPVLVNLQPDGSLRALGFITRDSLSQYNADDSLAVYFPQAYNFAGQVVIVKRSAVTPVDLPSGDVMTFIVSGGIAGK